MYLIRLISKMCKDSVAKTKQKTTEKNAEDPNRHFSKEHMEVPNRHMKRCSDSLITREMQIKTTV